MSVPGLREREQLGSLEQGEAIAVRQDGGLGPHGLSSHPRMTALCPQLLLAPEPLKNTWDEASHGQEKRLQDSGPQSLNLSGAKQVVIMVVTAPKLALESL